MPGGEGGFLIAPVFSWMLVCYLLTRQDARPKTRIHRTGRRRVRSATEGGRGTIERGRISASSSRHRAPERARCGPGRDPGANPPPCVTWMIAHAIRPEVLADRRAAAPRRGPARPAA